jgi:hypothetical protein
MISLAKLQRIRQGVGKKYKNIGLEKFRLSIKFFYTIVDIIISYSDCNNLI